MSTPEPAARDRHGILALFGREVLASTPRRRQRLIDEAFVYWRHHGFPYPVMTPDRLQHEFNLLKSTPTGGSLQRHLLHTSVVGLCIANAFHPQMWRVKVHGISPAQRFEDDDVLRRVLMKACQFWPNRRCWNAQCVRSVMRVHHRLRVANFRPLAAKAVFQQLSGDRARVLDFSAGFGGRLLGALALNRHYIGIDPAHQQTRGLNRMVRALSCLAPGVAEVRQGCAEDLLPLMPSSSIDLVFSSPPYFDHERYSNERTQSFNRYPSYGEWRERFLAVVVRETRRLLRPNGYLVLNVADTSRASLATDALTLATRELVFARRLRLAMNAVPSARAAGRLYRHEPVYIFQKR
jgi:SAM-dependent methyltransferase